MRQQSINNVDIGYMIILTELKTSTVNVKTKMGTIRTEKILQQNISWVSCNWI